MESLLTSLTKLQGTHKPDPVFLDALVRAADPLLPSARPPTVARMLHALSRLDGYGPSPDFLAAAERACAATAGQWDQSSLALVFQAWAWLRYQPADATVAALLDRARSMLVPPTGPGGARGGSSLSSSSSSSSFLPQNLGTLIHSLGEMKLCPDDSWMAAFRSAVMARLPGAAPKDVSFFLKGLAKLNYYPGPSVVDALLAALTPHVGGLQGIDLQFLVTSLVGLHHRPPPPFAAAFQRRALQLVSQAGAGPGIAPRDLALIIWSTAALEIPDSRSFLRALVAAAVAQLEGERPRWGLPEGHPEALSMQERWALTARVRQLRQVCLYAQCHAAAEAAAQGEEGAEQEEVGGLAEDFEALGLPALVDAGLAAGSEEMVLARAQESVFHKEVGACGCFVICFGGGGAVELDVALRWMLTLSPFHTNPHTRNAGGRSLAFARGQHAPGRGLLRPRRVDRTANAAVAFAAGCRLRTHSPAAAGATTATEHQQQWRRER
jgi:hypothetical protein